MRGFAGAILLTVMVLLAVPMGQCAEAPGVQESIEQGDLFLDDDKVGYAIQAYRQAIKRDPDNAEAHQRLARALSLNGDLEGALYEATRAAQLDPDSASAHSTRGRILGMMHRYRDSAAEEYMSLRLEPDNPSAYLTLGLALASLGDFDDAVGAIYEAIRLDPENVSAYVNLGAVLGRKGDYKSAVAVYQKALELNPNSVSTRLGLGAALGKTGDIEGQIREFKAAVDLAPNSDNAHGKLGWALYKHGDLEGAFREGWITNWLRLQKFGPQYLRMFTYVWAGVFLLFGAIFAVIFIGSKLTPQPDEIIIKSYFLTFYKDRPGRFVITNKRIVWIPEGFSKWFGAKDVSIDRNHVREIESLMTGNQGRLTFGLTDGASHVFTMPLFVFRPMKTQLDKLGERARLKLTGPWVIPKEVQEAIDAGLGAAETGVAKAETVPAPVSVEAAGPAPTIDLDEDEQRDTRTKWERIRRPTKVYTFVNGKLVEDESEADGAGTDQEEEVGKKEAAAESAQLADKEESAGAQPEKAPAAESVAEPVKPAPERKSAEAQPEKAPAAESVAEPVKPAPKRKSAEVQPKKAPAAESVAKPVPKEEAADNVSKKAAQSSQATPTRDTDKASKEESPSPDKSASPGPSLEKPEGTSPSDTEEPKE